MTADTPPRLSRGEHFDLAAAVATALEERISTENRMALLRRFGFNPAEYDSTWLEDLLRGEEPDLIELADYFELPVPSVDDDHPRIPTASAINTYSELVAAETAFREIVRSAIGDSWVEQLPEEKVGALREKRDTEEKRRDGVSVSQDLLDYTEAYQLESLILKNWETTGPILKDKKRTEVYLKLMLDVRNTVAHARPVVPHERQLLAGVAGQLQNLVSLHRSGSETADAFYASINYVRDPFGNEGRRDGVRHDQTRRRLKIGQVVEFDFSATDPHDREIQWDFRAYNKSKSKWSNLGIALGRSAKFSWTVGETEVGEQIDVWIYIANESPFQRNGDSDDKVCLGYSVSPPVPPRVV